MTKEASQQVRSAPPEKASPPVMAPALPEAAPGKKWFGMRLALWLWAAGFAVLLLQLLLDLVLGLWLLGLWRWA
jgi:hypothetical protein